MNIHTILRKIAKKNDSQTLFSMAKELNGIKLFSNETDLTEFQVLFLKYLNFYHTLYTDVAMGEVDEIVFKNEIYEDSYFLYKSEKDKKKETGVKEKEKAPNNINWVFNK